MTFSGTAQVTSLGDGCQRFENVWRSLLQESKYSLKDISTLDGEFIMRSRNVGHQSYCNAAANPRMKISNAPLIKADDSHSVDYFEH